MKIWLMLLVEGKDPPGGFGAQKNRLDFREGGHREDSRN